MGERYNWFDRLFAPRDVKRELITAELISMGPFPVVLQAMREETKAVGNGGPITIEAVRERVNRITKDRTHDQ